VTDSKAAEMICPDCGTDMRLNRAYTRSDGLLSKQYRCRPGKCLRNITVFEGKRTKLTSARRLDHDQVYGVLTGPEGVQEMADILQCHRQTVADIRLGRSYREYHTDIPRPGSSITGYISGSCHPCIHWKDHCTMGFPEGKRGSYAPLCTCYMETEQSQVSVAINYSDSTIRMDAVSVQ